MICQFIKPVKGFGTEMPRPFFFDLQHLNINVLFMHQIMQSLLIGFSVFTCKNEAINKYL
jgi:hypothetical protein